jgi:NAD(P)-dependent dehydrogenase (short-subunit alcohol dehydrogenase family)
MDNLNCEKSFPGGTQLYSNAKLYNVLFANELARRLEGTGDDFKLYLQKKKKRLHVCSLDVTSNSLHPGVVKTEIARKLPKVLATLFGMAIGFLCKVGVYYDKF